MDNKNKANEPTDENQAIEKLKFEVSQEMGIKPKVKTKKN